MGKHYHSAVDNYFTAEEAHKVIREAPNERDLILYQLLWVTAARIEEALELRAGDINVENSSVRLKRLKQFKRSKEEIDRDAPIPFKYHNVFVPTEIVGTLYAYCASLALSPTDYVFPGKDQGMHLSRYTAIHRFKKLTAALGITKLRPETDTKPRRETSAWLHLLRHGTAVNLVNQNVDILKIAKQLGHADVRNTQIYATVADVEQKKEIERVKW